MTDYYVGLMSGTSMDGIDAVVVRFADHSVDIMATHSHAYPTELRSALMLAARQPLQVELDSDGQLDRQVGACFLDAAQTVIEKSGVNRRDIVAVGSHGQTLRHQPNASPPFSLQIGNANTIANGTGITTVADFRTADIAAGGQGAPLVPPFHHWLFRDPDQARVVVNIGGIANITVIPSDVAPVIGFDTGPGNGLMDLWIRHHRDKAFDRDGRWAASGQVVDSILQQMLLDPYFALGSPKSTGFEYFNRQWLDQFDLQAHAPDDIQATLCELTATTITMAILGACTNVTEIYVCGGGANNAELMSRLQKQNREQTLASTVTAGLDPNWVEAVAFAWIAKRTIEGKPGNLPTVTGANQAVILGELHYPA